MGIKLKIGNKCVGGLGPCSLVDGSVPVSLNRPGLVDSAGLFVVSLTTLAHSILCPTLPQDSLSSSWCLTVGLFTCCSMKPFRREVAVCKHCRISFIGSA